MAMIEVKNITQSNSENLSYLIISVLILIKVDTVILASGLENNFRYAMVWKHNNVHHCRWIVSAGKKI